MRLRSADMAFLIHFVRQPRLFLDVGQQIRNIATTVPLSRTLLEMHRLSHPGRKCKRPQSPISGHPQVSGTVIRVLIRRPKKPNSGNRRCVLVKLTNGLEVTAWIPGEGHNLQEHSRVIVEGGRKQDCIGVPLRVVRGKLDCAPVSKTRPGALK